MRRLAAALVRDLMIIYQHAPNNVVLLDGVAETVLAQLGVDSADSDWAAQLRAVARDYRTPRPRPPARRAAPGHPAAGHHARAPAQGPLEDVLAAHPGRLQRTRRPALLPGPVRLPAWPRPERAAGLVGNPDETDGLHRLPITKFPLLRGLAPRPVRLRRSRRTRTRPRHPPHGLATSVTPRPPPRNSELSHFASGRPTPGCGGTTSSRDSASAGLLTSESRVRSKQTRASASAARRRRSVRGAAGRGAGAPRRVRPPRSGPQRRGPLHLRVDCAAGSRIPAARDPTPAAVAWIAVAGLTPVGTKVNGRVWPLLADCVLLDSGRGVSVPRLSSALRSPQRIQ
jgi:hypothetical protein